MEQVTRRGFLAQVVTALAVVPVTAGAAGHPHPAAQPGLTAAQRQTIDRLVAAFMKAHTVPGLSLAFARGGRSVYEQGFGFADITRRTPVTPDHRFRIASVSKPITACAVLDLVERGRLKLADPVFGSHGVLGTTYGRLPYGRHIERITVEHLLTHTCGGWPNRENDPMAQKHELAQGDLIAWVLETMPLAAEPGTRYEYSNFGYCLLGRVIERVTGRGYAEHVQQAVLGRCGIRDMAIAGSRLAERARLEVEYFGELGDDPYGWNVRRMDSHGGWLATARDLTRFAMHVDGFATPRDILSPDALRTMTQPSAAHPSYGRGWFVSRRGDWSHDGNLPGTTALLVRSSTGLCWAALANTRRLRSKMGDALDRLMRTVSKVLAKDGTAAGAGRQTRAVLSLEELTWPIGLPPTSPTRRL